MVASFGATPAACNEGRGALRTTATSSASTTKKPTARRATTQRPAKYYKLNCDDHGDAKLARRLREPRRALRRRQRLPRRQGQGRRPLPTWRATTARRAAAITSASTTSTRKAVMAVDNAKAVALLHEGLRQARRVLVLEPRLHVLPRPRREEGFPKMVALYTKGCNGGDPSGCSQPRRAIRKGRRRHRKANRWRSRTTRKAATRARWARA